LLNFFHDCIVPPAPKGSEEENDGEETQILHDEASLKHVEENWKQSGEG
jgi:hypothetical protein